MFGIKQDVSTQCDNTAVIKSLPSIQKEATQNHLPKEKNKIINYHCQSIAKYINLMFPSRFFFNKYLPNSSEDSLRTKQGTADPLT